jgi:hypothetical protein
VDVALERRRHDIHVSTPSLTHLALTNPPSTQRNQLTSPLLRLPGELRNKIYATAFREEYINVRRDANDRLHFRAATHALPSSTTITNYLFSRLFATTTVCRQIYAETAVLPVRLNVFRFAHVEALALFIGCTPIMQLERVRCIVLALPFTSTLGEGLERRGWGS